MRLLKLPAQVQESLVKEDISSGHARALINLPTEEMQIDLLKKILENNLSVRKVEQMVKKIMVSSDPPKRTVKFTAQSTSYAASLNDIEDKLRRVFGTKVICRQKHDGSGEITIEFYSNDELERLFELFEIISKSYN